WLPAIEIILIEKSDRCSPDWRAGMRHSRRPNAYPVERSVVGGRHAANQTIALQPTDDAQRAGAVFPLARHGESQRVALSDDLGDGAGAAHNSNDAPDESFTPRGIDLDPRRRGTGRGSDGNVPTADQPHVPGYR